MSLLAKARAAAAASDRCYLSEESKAHAGGELRRKLLALHVSKEMTAKDLCIIAHWHTLSGGRGLEDLAVRPDLQSSGHYQEHINLVIEKTFPRKTALYNVGLPSHDKKLGKREIVETPMNLPIDMLLHDLDPDDTDDCSDMSTPLCNDIASADDSMEWEPAYNDHPVVQACRANGVHSSRIRPVAIYMDAAIYTKRDSFEGIWINDLRTGKRHLLACVRKDDLCKCGCRGYCSIFILHWVIAWNLIFAAQGLNPDLTHTGGQDADPVRRNRAGTRLPFFLVVVQIRADWPGFCIPMGFRTCSHKTAGCVCCDVSKSRMGALSNISLDSGPWTTFTDADYWREVNSSRTTRYITDDLVRKQLVHCLWFDRRERGAFGRVLRKEFPLLQLVLGDRLTPTPLFPDVHTSPDPQQQIILFRRKQTIFSLLGNGKNHV